MCGRFVITAPDEALARLFRAAPANDLPEGPRYNVCPTQQIATVRSAAGTRLLAPMRWGFLPHWYESETDGPLLINARAESVASKPAFRAACRERRCLVPASGFYEWTKDDAGNRLPWYITRADGQAMAFAAIWQDWERAGRALRTCAIVTTEADGDIRSLHTRCPVILEPAQWAKWLGEAGHGAAALMTAPRAGTLTWHRVHPRVNSNRAEGPDLIAPLAA